MKKPFDEIRNLAIEFVEFDDKDQPKSTSAIFRLDIICMKPAIAQKNMK